MMGIDDAIGGVTTLLNTAIDKIWPNPEDKAKAEAITIMTAANAAVEQLKASQAVMLAEEQSQDKWTSRARPAFLYVIYILILASIPFAILFAFKPLIAAAVVQGFGQWLAAIPDSYLQLFGVGYLGYSANKSWETHSNNQVQIAKTKK